MKNHPPDHKIYLPRPYPKEEKSIITLLVGIVKHFEDSIFKEKLQFTGGFYKSNKLNKERILINLEDISTSD